MIDEVLNQVDKLEKEVIVLESEKKAIASKLIEIIVALYRIKNVKKIKTNHYKIVFKLTDWGYLLKIKFDNKKIFSSEFELSSLNKYRGGVSVFHKLDIKPDFYFHLEDILNILKYQIQETRFKIEKVIDLNESALELIEGI